MQRTIITLAALSAVASTVSAQEVLLGVEFRDGSFSGNNARLLDVDPATGVTSNVRFTGADVLSDIAQTPDGTLYAINDDFGVVNGSSAGSSLLTIDPATGATTVVGAAGVQLLEGDLAVGLDGTLFGTTSVNGTTSLLTFDTTTGEATTVGTLEGTATDASGLAFSPSGDLWLLDTTFAFPSTQAFLRRIDPSDASVLQTVPLDRALGTVAGLVFDDNDGTLYLADGDFGGTDMLYTVDLATGALTPQGTTVSRPPLFGGLSGLDFVVIPEPATATLLVGIAGCLLARRK